MVKDFFLFNPNPCIIGVQNYDIYINGTQHFPARMTLQSNLIPLADTTTHMNGYGGLLVCLSDYTTAINRSHLDGDHVFRIVPHVSPTVTHRIEVCGTFFCLLYEKITRKKIYF